MAFQPPSAASARAGPPGTQREEQPLTGWEDPDDYRMGKVPLLMGKQVLIDDRDASYVLVFPREKDANGDGMVEPDALVMDPKTDWDKIFRPHSLFNDSAPAMKHKPMPQRHYQKAVRARVLEILRQLGFKAMAVESIDKDEVFLKLSLDRDGMPIRKMAEMFQYTLPYARGAYRQEQPFGTYPGGRPMQNANGQEVPAFDTYSEDLADQLEPFRSVDEIRIIRMQLNQVLNIEEMVRQKVLSRCYPGANYDLVLQLHEEWADWQNVLVVPSNQHDKQVREYFGEEIAFFFRWFAVYTSMLRYLALGGLICWLRNRFTGSLGDRDEAYMFFAIGMITWETVFHETVKAGDRRATQLWGMEDFEHLEADMPSYDPNLEGTHRLDARKSLSTVVVILYLLVFIGIIAALNWYTREQMLAGHKRFVKIQPIIQSALIKVLSFTWRKISYHLVTWQNHRTQTRWNNALVWNLSVVKLFVALWPFFYTAFVQNLRNSTCGEDLSTVAHTIYGNQGWPSGVNVSVAAGDVDRAIPLSELSFLNNHWFQEGAKICVIGCYPKECMAASFDDPTRIDCRSNCTIALRASLTTLYLVHLASTVVFIIIPIVLTRWAVHEEMSKVKGQSHPGRPGPTYTFIQLQAKCHEWAPYEFSSWGGSYVEDFLELTVGYALLACFGICLPVMSCIGFVCFMLEYRLLAYRMTNVTCRPEPRGASGIGAFQEVMEVVSLIALSMNVGLAVHTMLPGRRWPPWKQLLAFICAEKAMLMLRSFIGFFMPDEPYDVVLIADFNSSFKKKGINVQSVNKDEMNDYSGIDVGLTRPYTADDDASTASSSE